MTALLTREVAVAPAHYVVEHPRTGEVLGYVTIAPGRCSEPLCRALQDRGFRLVDAERVNGLTAAQAILV